MCSTSKQYVFITVFFDSTRQRVCQISFFSISKYPHQTSKFPIWTPYSILNLKEDPENTKLNTGQLIVTKVMFNRVLQKINNRRWFRVLNHHVSFKRLFKTLPVLLGIDRSFKYILFVRSLMFLVPCNFLLIVDARKWEIKARNQRTVSYDKMIKKY